MHPTRERAAPCAARTSRDRHEESAVVSQGGGRRIGSDAGGMRVRAGPAR